MPEPLRHTPARSPLVPTGSSGARLLAPRPRSLRVGVVALVALVALVLAACGAGSSTQGGDSGFVAGSPGLTQVAPAERQPAPDVRGESLDSRTVALSDYRGRVVVINVWGSWCGPCRAEVPELVKAAEATKGTAVFVGINIQDPGKAAAQAFVRANAVPYPSIYDPSGEQLVKFAGTLPPQAIPSTLILDAEGRIAARIIGTTSERTLVGLVDDVAAGK